MRQYQPFHQASPRELEILVKDFNRKFPIGTPVMLRSDSGPVSTVVTAAAVLMGGHSAVAWFEGVSGAYSIERGRVTPSPVHASLSFKGMVH